MHAEGKIQKIEKWDGSKIACRDFKKFQENDL